MSSGPVALFGFKRFIKVSTSFAVQEMTVRVFKVLALKGWELGVTVIYVIFCYQMMYTSFLALEK